MIRLCLCCASHVTECTNRIICLTLDGEIIIVNMLFDHDANVVD